LSCTPAVRGFSRLRQATEPSGLHAGAKLAASLTVVHAGHGLHFNNVQPVAAIREIVEPTSGHCIISRAVFDGPRSPVREMKALMWRPREMIFGIASTSSKQSALTRPGALRARFVQHLLMPAEQVQLAKNQRPARFLAMRFAAKEAIGQSHVTASPMASGFAT